MEERYCLVKDNDAHWYLCPAAYRERAYEYFEAIEQTWREKPDWLRELGSGYSDLTFTRPQTGRVVLHG